MGMKKRLRRWTSRVAQICKAPVAWVAGMAAALSPMAKSPAQAQVVPTATGTGTTVAESGGQFDIDGGTQVGGNLFHEFDDFSVGETQTANFLTDSGVFNVVGQVSAANPSYIDGTVQVSGSDANLYLINPSGVLFGPDAQLSLSGSFTATSADQIEFEGEVLNVLDNDAGYSTFTGDPSAFHFTETSASAVVNQADLAVASGESISLIGGNVANAGTLSAPGGEIGLVAVGGESTVRYGIPGSLLGLEMTQGSVPAGTGFAVTDLPALLTGSATPLVNDLTLQPDGSYKLGALQIEDEEVSVAGELSTRAIVGDDGGAIALLGRSVDAFGAVIDASGDNGGYIRIGRDLESGTLPTSDLVLMNRTSIVRAAGLNGSGGDVVVGSNIRATVRGDLSAHGTTTGGLIETSSAQLTLNDVQIDASGQTGNGRWLIDPVDIEIVGSAGGANQIESGLIEATLDGGTDVEIVTTMGAGGNGDIFLLDDIDQTGGGSANLTLNGRRFETDGATIDLSSAGQLTFNLNQVNPEATPDSSSIAEALDAIGSVSGRRLINLGSGDYSFANRLTLNTNVEIEGAGAVNTTLSALGSYRHFDVNDGVAVTLRNLTLTTSGLAAGQRGGGIENTGQLTVEGVHFVDNRATNGGAITSHQVSPLNPALLTIVDSEFRDNSAQNAGAISLYDFATTNISNTLFENNSVVGDGGALRASESALRIDGNSRFVRNSAGNSGGALAVRGVSNTVFDTVAFEENTAGRDGGALTSWRSAIISFENATLSQNQANNLGGALFLSDSSFVDVETSTFGDNQAASGGGIFFSSSSSGTLSNTLFSSNVAIDDGGAIVSYGAALAISGGSQFIGNTADDSGGALALRSGTVQLDDVLIEGNSALRSGGGITTWDGNTLSTNNTVIRANQSSEDGGGLAIVDSTYTSVNITIEDNGAIAANPNDLHGGGLFSYNSQITLDNSTVRNNTAARDGGGLHSVDSAVNIVGSLFDGNTATAGDGGGVSLSGSATVGVVDDVTFTNNFAGSDGGAIRALNATVSIEGVRNRDVINNRASVQGGAIALENSTVTLNNLDIADNTSNGDGGAIALSGTTNLVLSATTLDNNQASDQGGALYNVASGNQQLVDATFTQNRAVSDGGAIAHNTAAGSLSVRNSTFTENTTQEDGGALYTHTGSNTALDGTRFVRNQANDNGGAAHFAGNATVENSEFKDNSATQGGGINVAQNANLLLRDSTFTANQAGDKGGGLAVNNNAIATVQGNLTLAADGRAASATTRFIGNVAGDDGGGIVTSDRSRITLTNALLSGNRASDDGGGLAVIRDSVATVENSNFENNRAEEMGGGFYRNDTNPFTVSADNSVVNNSRFIDNVANTSGGGFAQGINSASSVRNSLFRENVAAIDGGGIYVTAGELAVENSFLVANEANYGAGLEVSLAGEATVIDTAIQQNVAVWSGGGIQADLDTTLTVSGSTLERNEASDGGGLLNQGSTTLLNTTFSGNTANNNGGAINSRTANARLMIRNSTLTANQAANSAGGISLFATQGASLLNTIVAGNSSPNAADVSGTFSDQGGNLVGMSAGATGFVNSTLVGTAASPIDSGLAPLADNGGPTKTHLLRTDSVAVNAGRAINLPVVDQRGQVRFFGSNVDIGAVELGVDVPAPSGTSPGVPVTTSLSVDSLNGTFFDPTLSSTSLDGLGGVSFTRKSHDLSDSNRAIRQLERSFSQGFEDYWDLAAGPDLTFDDVQAILRRAQEEYEVNSAVIYATFVPEDPAEADEDNILQVEPVASGDDLLNLSVVLPEGELVSYELPVTRSQVSRQVRLLRSTVSGPEDTRSYRPLTQQLYQWLLAPIENDLAAQNIHNLMYALDDGLRTAPIATMRDYQGFSLERYGISVVPSVGLMQADFSLSVRRPTVAMGVSEFVSDQPLPAVPVELDAVKSIVPVSQTLLNEGSTVQALASVQALEQPGVLHLATHAVFDNHSAESSYIQMWDQPLSMQDFSTLGWGASDLELLILSACSTALSGRNSELGFAGLAAAAGVDATVGSLWEVSDVGTLALMSEFYAQLESTDVRFEALRQAQLSLLRGETRIEGGDLVTSQGRVDLPDEWDLPESATLDHPFFWSAFTMIGNPW